MKSASHIEAPGGEDSINGQHENNSQKQSEKYLRETSQAALARSLRNFHAGLVYASRRQRTAGVWANGLNLDPTFNFSEIPQRQEFFC